MYIIGFPFVFRHKTIILWLFWVWTLDDHSCEKLL